MQRRQVMKQFNQLICPVSPERIDENKVRVTALGIILLTGSYFITGHVIFPIILVLDFFIRAATRLPNSPVSWLAHHFVRAMGTRPIWIDKAPKMFAARVGLLLSTAMLAGNAFGFPLLTYFVGTTLVVFAFLECGLNFCAGCWLYTYVVYPLVRGKN